LAENKNSQKHILVTGTAGFIGFHLAERLLKEGYRVTGIDNLNDYYDVKLKYARLAESGIQKSQIDWGKVAISTQYPDYRFIRINLEDKEAIDALFAKEEFDIVVNLAAQAGVRYSIENPDVYIKSNITGFYNILEACRHHPVEHLVYASSSSVYGDSEEVPFKEDARVDNPISLYAATKKSNELMAHTYSHLYKIPTTGLRFFTVYGPWGRPDMALSLFTEKIMNEEPIQVFNQGKLSRDFTYVGDIIEGILLTVKQVPSADNGQTPYTLLNIGNGQPVQLMDFIQAIEMALDKKAIIDFQPMQAGDVHQTWADTSSLAKLTDFRSEVGVEEGVADFVNWYVNQ
jgi:UDP-glucuronate 4-epimerase